MAGGVCAPAVDEGGHVGGNGGGEEHFLAGMGMTETERTGMQGLTGTDVHAVSYESLI